MRKNIYRGYSSFEFDRNKTFRVSDIEIVKFDLLNHIWTKKGERVMHADFGSVISELVFEPLDEFLMETIREELIRIFEYDPRVEMLSLDLIPDFNSNSLFAVANLLYVEFNVTQNFDLRLEFNSENA